MVQAVKTRTWRLASKALEGFPGTVVRQIFVVFEGITKLQNIVKQKSHC